MLPRRAPDVREHARQVFGSLDERQGATRLDAAQSGVNPRCRPRIPASACLALRFRGKRFRFVDQSTAELNIT